MVLVYDRLSDTALISQDPWIRSESLKALVNFYRQSPAIAKRNPRVLLVLCKQDMMPTVGEEVCGFLLEHSTPQELLLRIAMTAKRHIFPSPIGLYRDILNDIS